MKKVFAIGALALLLAIPTAVSTHPECHRSVHNEGMTHPLGTGTYLFIDAATPEKIGEWREDNGFSGLQTGDCIVNNVLRYAADVRLDTLP